MTEKNDESLRGGNSPAAHSPPPPPESRDPPGLSGSTCPRALAGLGHFHGRAAAAPSVNGQAVDLDTAVRSAAEVLRRSRLPLFGGLATDVLTGAIAVLALLRLGLQATPAPPARAPSRPYPQRRPNGPHGKRKPRKPVRSR